jgi:arginyl-tRNA synthetase
MRLIEETREQIRQALREAISRAAEAGELSGALPPQIILEAPKEKAHGAFATNLAMMLAKGERKPPRAVAEAIVKHFPAGGAWVDCLEVAGPGFINFHLKPNWIYRVLPAIQEEGSDFGRSRHGQGKRILVEFVSANPTGPMVIVNARAAAAGDVLCDLLDYAGYGVHREYYVNDAGNQFRNLALAMETRYRQLLGQAAELPEGAYPGEYIIDLAKDLLAAEGGELLSLPQDQRHEIIGRFAVERIVKGQRAILEDYGVRFDRWFHESTIRAEKGPERVIELLRERGYTYAAEGALWFRSTEFGDDKDRVIVKTDGNYTYIVPDIAYHLNKFERGFDTLIDIWGQDHHGYIPRMRAAIQALGYRAESFEVLTNQMVRLVRGGQAVRMSKRKGEFVLMEELLEEVGKDAARYFFLMRSLDAHMDFDLDLAQLQTNDNPVYYVQYAHARICSLIRQAAETGLAVPKAGEVDLSLLRDESEIDLCRKLADLPEEIIGAADSREPQRMTRYLTDLATLFHSFYTRRRVITEDRELTRARLTLVDAARIGIKNVLDLLGVAAPERM